MESNDESDESGIQLSVGKVRASAHAGSRSVRVVRSSRTLRVVQVTVYAEGFRVLEVGGVEIGSPSVLGVGVSREKVTFFPVMRIDMLTM